MPKVHPAILLRTAYEVFRNDTDKNQASCCEWLGQIRRSGYRAKYEGIHGVSDGWERSDHGAESHQNRSVSGVQQSTWQIRRKIDRNYPDRAGAFTESQRLSICEREGSLKGLGTETNLAAMDWQDFEHLIRELFEKEFSGRGAEVKITQASRDRGVDAVVFDPDPIHGGKYVIQAKRYTNTVDVSAVRDLCAVVKKEGASRGILVTTSTYGADAYAFANNEPVTLLNGAELLGLLKKHGYTFRINLQEARRSV